MKTSPEFCRRIWLTIDTNLLHRELNVIRRIVIDELHPELRDELCQKQRIIQNRLRRLRTSGT